MRQKKIIALNVGMLLLYFITRSYIPLVIALIFSSLETFSEKISEKVFFFIERMLKKIGNVFFNLVLLFTFYFVITPVGIVWRTFSKKDSKDQKSYFKEVNKSFKLADFERQF